VLIPLTPDQVEALMQFGMLEITLDDLRQRTRGAMEVDFDGDRRSITEHFEIPKPLIQITKKHIETALNKRRCGEITENQLSDWASVLVMTHAYDWEGPEMDEIGEWLHDLCHLVDRSE
jgi:hypothetical protein